MENPTVESAVGIHLWPQVPSGVIDIVDGPQMAASHFFCLTIQGKERCIGAQFPPPQDSG